VEAQASIQASREEVYCIAMSPPAWSVLHSTVKIAPLLAVKEAPLEPGQDRVRFSRAVGAAKAVAARREINPNLVVYCILRTIVYDQIYVIG